MSYVIVSAATCPVPLSPDGGSVYVQTDGAVTTAHYVCAEDYSLYGAEIRTCLSDNTWEFDMPACSKGFEVIVMDLGELKNECFSLLAY